MVLISARYSNGRIYLFFGVIGLSEKVFVLDNHRMFSSSVANNMPSPLRREKSPQSNHNNGEEDQETLVDATQNDSSEGTPRFQESDRSSQECGSSTARRKKPSAKKRAKRRRETSSTQIIARGVSSVHICESPSDFSFEIEPKFPVSSVFPLHSLRNSFTKKQQGQERLNSLSSGTEHSFRSLDSFNIS